MLYTEMAFFSPVVWEACEEKETDDTSVTIGGGICRQFPFYWTANVGQSLTHPLINCADFPRAISLLLQPPPTRSTQSDVS